MALEQITDHAARALSRVITALRGTEFENLVRVFTSEIQALEDAFFGILTVIRNPAIATGATLDLIGKIVGAEERGELDDATYRTRIAAAIARNVAWTEPESVIATVLAFFPPNLLLGGPRHTLIDSDVMGTRSASLVPVSWYLIDGYPGISAESAEEFMRYLARTAATRVVFHYAPTPDTGAGSLARFDTPGQGFDNGCAMSGAVDQNTRN